MCQSCGITLDEVTAYLQTKPDTTKSWWVGRRNPPELILEKLIDLSIKQDIAAQELLLNIGSVKRNTQRIVLQADLSDVQAGALGWPSANAYRAVIRRAVEKMPPKLALRLVLVSSEERQ